MIVECYRLPGVPLRGAHPVGGDRVLLTRLGSHAAMKFANRLAAHDLTPPQAAILRLLRVSPGLSQQALAEQLDVLPSRVVAFVDDLERRGFVQRERNPDDRRANVLQLRPSSSAAFHAITTVGQAHEDDICRSLSIAERRQLATLLQRIADEQGLTPGVHPGYQGMISDDRDGTADPTEHGRP